MHINQDVIFAYLEDWVALEKITLAQQFSTNHDESLVAVGGIGNYGKLNLLETPAVGIGYYG